MSKKTDDKKTLKEKRYRVKKKTDASKLELVLEIIEAVLDIISDIL